MSKIIPRYYQKKAFEDYFDFISKNHGLHPLVIIPTGGGKTAWQAMVVEKMMEWDKTRVLLLSHQKELLKQNATEIYNYLEGNVDIGVYSAGIGLRQHKNRVIVAGIQSVWKKAWTHIGHRDMIIIDEAHLVNSKNKGMYRHFLEEMQQINKNIVIGGMTATCYRMKSGLLTEGDDPLFDAICHETTVKELVDPNDYRNIDNKQYLCNLISKGGINKADLSKVHVRGGEYIPKEMQDAFMQDDLVCKAVKEIYDLTKDRKKVLVFTAGIQHCEEVLEKMQLLGMKAGLMHSKKSNNENDEILRQFDTGEIKYCLNAKMLTTGYNARDIDCVVLMFSTLSPGLYYQCVGRGLRLHELKENCLILDMGRNIERHGPIDKIEIKERKNGTKGAVGSPTKECPECHSLLHSTVMICPDCEYEFPQSDKHDEKASEADILSKWKPPLEIDVERIRYWRHEKKGSPDSLRVDYYANMVDKYSVWVAIENPKARRYALQWLKNVTDQEINTVEEALDLCETFREPSKIIVDTNNKYDKITGYVFEEEEKESMPEIIQPSQEKTSVDDDSLWRLMS